MIRLRRGIVSEVRAAHPGLSELVVEIDGRYERAIAYPTLVGPVHPGAQVVLNTTAVELGLGTGGVHIVVAVEGTDTLEGPSANEMKLRYTPHQVAVPVVEETHRDVLDAVESLDGMQVVICSLHSAVAPAAIGARATNPDARVAYVMTDAGALVAWMSNTIPELRAAGLIDATITAGQAIGGDLEAVTIFGALAAARAVVDADVVIVAMGPGNLGTGSRWGSGALEVASLIDAVAGMGGWPQVAPRISFADDRARHRGVSHHTITALEIARADASIDLPPMLEDRSALVRKQLAHLQFKHNIGEIAGMEAADEALRSSPVELRSMGRTFSDDPDYFRTAAAAGVFAARARWKE